MRTTYDLNNIDYGSLMLQTGYLTLRLDRDRPALRLPPTTKCG